MKSSPSKFTFFVSQLTTSKPLLTRWEKPMSANFPPFQNTSAKLVIRWMYIYIDRMNCVDTEQNWRHHIMKEAMWSIKCKSSKKIKVEIASFYDSLL